MREMKDALCLGRERQFDRSRNPFAQDCAALDFSANRFDRDLGAGKETAGEGFVFAHQTEQEVLRLDDRRAKLSCFVARKENNPTRFFSIAFEHQLSTKYECRDRFGS